MRDMLGQTLEKNDIALYNGMYVKILNISNKKILYSTYTLCKTITKHTTHLNSNFIKLTNFNIEYINTKINNTPEELVIDADKPKTPEEIEQEQKEKEYKKELLKSCKIGSIIKSNNEAYLYLGKIQNLHTYYYIYYYRNFDFNNYNINDIINSADYLAIAYCHRLETFKTKKKIQSISETPINLTSLNILIQKLKNKMCHIYEDSCLYNEALARLNTLKEGLK